MREPVLAKLTALLVVDLFVEMKPEQIGLNDGLQTDIGLDSIGFVELRVLCERHFGIVISDEEFSPEHFRSLNALASLILAKQGAPTES